MLVLVADVVPRFDSCADYFAEIRGGAFRCEDTPLGLYTAFVRGDGTEWTRRPIYLKSGELFDLGVIELAPLPSEALIRGTVCDAEGRPLEGADVSYPLGSCGFVDMVTTTDWTTRTNAAGEFSLSPIERKVFLDSHFPGYRRVGPFEGWFGVEASWGDTVHLRMDRFPPSPPLFPESR